MAKKIHDFEITLQSKTIFEKTRVDIADHLKALRFGLNKYVMIMLQGMVGWFKEDGKTYYYRFEGDNPLFTKEEDWQLFLREGEKELICKALEKEIAIENQFVFSVSWKAMNQIFKMNKPTLIRLNIDEMFLSNDLQCFESFFITLYNLSLGLAKLIIPEVLRVRNQPEAILRAASTLVLLDDLFILLSLESIFQYKDGNQINFNVFMEGRKKNYSDDPDGYSDMLKRVIKTYEVFFE